MYLYPKIITVVLHCACALWTEHYTAILINVRVHWLKIGQAYLSMYSQVYATDINVYLDHSLALIMTIMHAWFC